MLFWVAEGAGVGVEDVVTGRQLDPYCVSIGIGTPKVVISASVTTSEVPEVIVC